MVSVVLVLGFDITHAVITLVSFRPRTVTAVTALVDGRIDQRSLVAYNSLEQVALALGARCERVDVEVLRFSNAVETLRSILLRHVSSETSVVLDLGGGLRMLVVEALTALLSLPRSLRRYFKVLLYIEGQNRTVELNSDDIAQELMKGKEILWSKLSYLEKTILEKMEYSTPYTLGQIHQVVAQLGETVSKQNLVRILNKLVKRGYVERVRRGVYIKRVSVPQ